MELEINKCISKTQVLTETLKSSIQKDISYITEFLLSEYDIKLRGSNTFVTKDALLNSIIKNFGIHKKESCSAITTSNNRCSFKPINNSKYCKKHQQLSYQTENHQTHYNNLQSNNLIFIENQTTQKITPTQILQKKLINDTFYLIDDHFIYDIPSKNKVGYIIDQNYILTDDPFELGISVFD